MSIKKNYLFCSFSRLVILRMSTDLKVYTLYETECFVWSMLLSGKFKSTMVTIEGVNLIEFNI